MNNKTNNPEPAILFVCVVVLLIMFFYTGYQHGHTEGYLKGFDDAVAKYVTKGR